MQIEVVMLENTGGVYLNFNYGEEKKGEIQISVGDSYQRKNK